MSDSEIRAVFLKKTPIGTEQQAVREIVRATFGFKLARTREFKKESDVILSNKAIKPGQRNF